MGIPFARGALPFPCSLPIWSVRVGAKGLSAYAPVLCGVPRHIYARPGVLVAALVAATPASPLAPLRDAPTYHSTIWF